MHEHEFQGQKLVHTHPGEGRAHGYFEHPEDGHPLTEATAGTPAPSPSAAETGRYIVMCLVQLEERLANHPRAFKDPRLASILGCIRDEADGLTERYEFMPQAGRCAACGTGDVLLTGALADDTDLYVCQVCHDNPELLTVALEALWDDRAVYTITRGDLVRSAGRELTEDEISEVTGQMENSESVREGVDESVYRVLGSPEADAL
jgi:hypothetical protein